MAKVVQFSVHKNTVGKRKSREIVRRFGNTGRKAQDTVGELDGYAFVAWNSESDAVVFMENGVVHLGVLPEFVSNTIRREINVEDARNAIDGE